MQFGWKPARTSIVLALLCVVCGACQKNGAMSPTAPETASLRSGAPTSSGAPSSATSLAAHAPSSSTPVSCAAGGSENGAASERPVYYDSKLFTVNMVELPKDASASIIARNPGFNEIYATNDLDEEQDLLSVIDAIPGDGMNPLWRQNLIAFNAGFTPHQFKSDDEVLAAASGSNPEITIVPTDEIYRCAVVRTK
jgi:hypothetical protein